ncbi:MAG: hypothetical protein IJC69_01445 [Clostridia bacterium]|nr:hypothetical protein [Clostridia bacterium]
MKTITNRTLTIILALTFLVAIAVSAAEPGSPEDPLISKSYVETNLIPYVNKVSSYTVVNLSANQMLIGDAGCEIILRMGTATVIATEKGGLCDITLGGDWPHGSAVPANHNLIVPLSDGRGIKADTDIIIMVKGTYTLY